MNFDELLDAHTGREENLIRQRENFARSKKHARVRRLAKRELLIKKAAKALRKTEVEAEVRSQARRDLAGRIIMDERQMRIAAEEYVARSGIRGNCLMIDRDGSITWSDIDVDRVLRSSRYLEVPVYENRMTFDPSHPPTMQSSVTTRRYEILDRVLGELRGPWVKGGGGSAYILGQVS